MAGRLVRALVLAACVFVVAAGWTARPARVLAAAPTPTPAQVGDPRSSGEGAGLVGSPLLAVGGMLVVGLVAAGGTLIYVRLTGGPRGD
jgi:hypothetical protein